MSEMAANSATPPISDEWTSTSWETTFAAADRVPPKGREVALECLQAIFPPSLTSALQADRHPVVGEQLWIRGRLELLELGLAVACVGIDKKELGRLQHQDQYLGTSAELRALLLPVRAGARLVRPPAVKGKKICERIAEFPSGLRLAVESKQPSVGERDLDKQAVEQFVFMELMQQLAGLSDLLPSARVTLKFGTTGYDLGNRLRVDEGRVRTIVAVAAERLRSAIQEDPSARAIALGSIGELVVERDQQLGRLQFDATSPRDARAGFLRIRRTILNPAARQLADSGLPGLLVLDLERDRAALDAFQLLAKWAETKPAIGAVVLIDRHMMNGRQCNGAYIVPGPRFDEIADDLCRGFDSCSAGHIHYAPMSTPAEPCPTTWLPTYTLT